MKINEIAKKDNQTIFIIDIPLLIETDNQDTVDKVVLVYTSRQVQIERLVKRDGLSLEDAHKRLASRLAIENKKSKRDFSRAKKKEAQKQKNYDNLSSSLRAVFDWGVLGYLSITRRRIIRALSLSPRILKQMPCLTKASGTLFPWKGEKGTGYFFSVHLHLRKSSLSPFSHSLRKKLKQ